MVMTGRRVLGGAALFVAAGCAAFGPRTDPPSVTVAELHPKDGTLLEQRFLAKIRIQNPNPVDLPVEGISYDLALNGRPFAKGVGKADVVIPAYGQDVIETEAITTLMGFVRQLEQVRAGGPKMSYRLTGKLKLRDQASPVSFEMTGEDLLGLGPSKTSP
jgi:LEA14-like dessication related protein